MYKWPALLSLYSVKVGPLFLIRFSTDFQFRFSDLKSMEPFEFHLFFKVCKSYHYFYFDCFSLDIWFLMLAKLLCLHEYVNLTYRWINLGQCRKSCQWKLCMNLRHFWFYVKWELRKVVQNNQNRKMIEFTDFMLQFCHEVVIREHL